MKKALLVTTVSGFVPQFEMNNVKILQEMGMEVHYAANYHTPSYGKDNRRLDGTGIFRHQIDFERSPFKIENIKVYRQLKKLMTEERFDLVHCHTPMGGVMARLAAHATGTRPVIYTAHGFHFFKGAPLKNWLFYYPVEKFLSRYTDEQICINQEDYRWARRYFFAKNIDYIPGVGIDLSSVIPVTQEKRSEKRLEFGIPEEKVILLSVGELIKRKNHETVIRALARLKNDNLIYVICGQGELEEYLKKLVRDLGIEEQVLFLGYREDVSEIYSAADVFVFPSYQEGLPRALLEAMASGLPALCSNIRGNSDLMGGGQKALGKGASLCEGGILIDRADDVEAFAQGINCMLEAKDNWQDMGNCNADRSRDFSLEEVGSRMKKIYEKLLV